jgi:pimeloyl-ACP methyl ester carboxylesterase
MRASVGTLRTASSIPVRQLVLWMATLAVCVSARPALAAPCTTATAACTEWVTVRPSTGRSLVYSSHALTAPNAQITRALIVVHGGGRDADSYFRSAVAAALLSGALDDTVVMAPRLASRQGACQDSLATGEINWDCGEGSAGGWRSGAPSVSHGAVTTYDLVDQLIERATQVALFPNLRHVTVAGFSAGGQFVSRYQMANQVHEKTRVPITYVVASPSSYPYLDGRRPDAGGTSFAAPTDVSACPGYDRWSYGLNQRTGYSASETDEQLRRQFLSRPTTFVVGQLETPDAPALDVACQAMLQGVSRMTRARAFLKYATEQFGATHPLLVVPQCGHNQRCVLTADSVLPLLFPRP